MSKRKQPLRRGTPIRNAVLVFSLTCNLFLFTLAYGVYSGQLARIETVEPVDLAQLARAK